MEAKKQKKKQDKIYIDPKTGKRISKTGWMMRQVKEMGGWVEVLDMKAVLK